MFLASARSVACVTKACKLRTASSPPPRISERGSSFWKPSSFHVGPGPGIAQCAEHVSSCAPSREGARLLYISDRSAVSSSSSLCPRADLSASKAIFWDSSGYADPVKYCHIANMDLKGVFLQHWGTHRPTILTKEFLKLSVRIVGQHMGCGVAQYLSPEETRGFLPQ
jgi:hypothetical protein